MPYVGWGLQQQKLILIALANGTTNQSRLAGGFAPKNVGLEITLIVSEISHNLPGGHDNICE